MNTEQTNKNIFMHKNTKALIYYRLYGSVAEQI